MSNFKFDWVPETELKPKSIILEEGKGHFLIDKVHTIHSKTGDPLRTLDGRPKITLQLLVTDTSGQKGIVYQDVTTAMPWLIKALADAVGIPALYSQGGLDLVRIVGCEGECIIKTKSSPGYSDKTTVGQFLAKNEDHTYDLPGHDEDNKLPF
jgi:hypothetical protein